jgi:2-oxoglutarate ferredoxin oxidoreductase subunit beta
LVSLKDYKGLTPAWCPGCGNFAILRAFNEALLELNIAPHEIVIVSGIGQAGKFPHYTRCNTFNGLHGRTLPVATGIKLVNPKLKVIAVAGDGDCYGEGGNHLIHAIRRNVDIKLFVHNNQIYGLTKGQASPTTKKGVKTKTQPFGVVSEPLNPLLLAIALDCSFVARGYAGEVEHLKNLMKEAFLHKGFALLDILQPCVTFNKINTFEWYNERVYFLDSTYDPTNKILAFEKAGEWGEKIPLGILFKKEKPTFEEMIPILKKGPLFDLPYNTEKVRSLIERFK